MDTETYSDEIRVTSNSSEANNDLPYVEPQSRDQLSYSTPKDRKNLFKSVTPTYIPNMMRWWQNISMFYVGGLFENWISGGDSKNLIYNFLRDRRETLKIISEQYSSILNHNYILRRRSRGDRRFIIKFLENKIGSGNGIPFLRMRNCK